MDVSQMANKPGVRWSLDDLLPEGPEQFESMVGEVESAVKAIESYRPIVGTTITLEDFLNLLRLIEELRQRTAILAAYAFLSFALNTQDPQALSLQDRVNQILTGVDNRILFFSLWFKALNDDAARGYMAMAGDLRYYLESIRRFTPYTLSEPEEKVINLKDSNGSLALVKLYEIITNGLSFSLEVDGKVKKLTRDSLTQYYRHPSAAVRAATYRELYRVYGENRTALAQIYSSLVRDWVTEGVELRGYPSPIAIRNLGNDIPHAVVSVLLETCRKNSGLFQRYFKLKARLIGMDKLRRYDIYAPIAQAEKTIPFGEAITLVIDCFERFSPQVAQAASQVMQASHLDAEIRPGKRGGAFSYSPTPRLIPWVLINYNERIRDVTTLAHELGHSVHAILASSHSILSFHSSLPLAETASVFAEMLVTDRLLGDENDPAVRRDLLITMLDDAYATVERQAFITMFERVAHDRIVKGATSQELAQLYMDNLAEQFGEAVEVEEEFAWEWLTIPHIYTAPFYPYAYSFGQLLVLAMYQQYLASPEAFVPGYIKLLSYGGSAEPMAILNEAGIDISSSIFWQGGFDALQNKLEQLEQITGGNS